MRIAFDGTQLYAALSALEASASSAAMQTALNAAAAVVQGSAKRLCPANDGQLRNSIVVAHEPDGGTVVAATAAHAIFVEFGTGYRGNPAVAHTTKKQWFVPVSAINPADARRYHFRKVAVGRAGGKEFYIVRPQRPQPFMAPAATQSASAAQKRFAATLRKQIQQEVPHD